MITLDVSLTSCQYSGIDRRYTGTFLLRVPDNAGQVNLVAYSRRFLGKKSAGTASGARFVASDIGVPYGFVVNAEIILAMKKISLGAASYCICNLSPSVVAQAFRDD